VVRRSSTAITVEHHHTLVAKPVVDPESVIVHSETNMNPEIDEAANEIERTRKPDPDADRGAKSSK